MASERKGRPRTGSLYWTKSGWRARLTVDVDGVQVQRSRDLGTTDKAVARAKLKRLLSGDELPTSEQTKQAESVADASDRIVKRQKAEGLKTWPERLALLNRYTLDHVKQMPVTEVRPQHIRELLEAARDSGLSRQSVTHLRNALSGVFDSLWRDETIPENPVKRARVPKGCKVDKRPRVTPTDEEFQRFMACAAVPEHLAMMALASRAFGGMRTSDLHAWDWSHVDTAGWQTALVYRPKTDGDEPVELEELVMPPVLKDPLKTWWDRWDRPTEGPVFPVMVGKRAGERQAKRSHARELRAALWAAGVHRPMPGLEDALTALRLAQAAVEPAKAESRKAWWHARRARRKAELEAKKLDAMQTDTARTRAVDFHSLRRSYNTALALAGVNVQTAMALAGHKDPRTHVRYVQLAQMGPLETPEAALPVLLAGVSAWAMQKLSDQSDLSIGDPNETRTRVTGVRGRCPNR